MHLHFLDVFMLVTKILISSSVLFITLFNSFVFYKRDALYDLQPSLGFSQLLIYLYHAFPQTRSAQLPKSTPGRR